MYERLRNIASRCQVIRGMPKLLQRFRRQLFSREDVMSISFYMETPLTVFKHVHCLQCPY